MQAAHTRAVQAGEITVMGQMAISEQLKSAVFLETQQPLSQSKQQQLGLKNLH